MGKLKLLTLALGTIIAVAIGCGDDKDDAPAASTSATAYVDGSWASPCFDDGGSVYMIIGVVLSNGSFVVTETSYSDAACTTQTGQTSQTGTAVIGASVSTTVGTAKEFDTTDSGGTEYDLVFRDSSVSPERLYFGDELTGDKTSVANRPTEIDNVNFYLEAQ